MLYCTHGLGGITLSRKDNYNSCVEFFICLIRKIKKSIKDIKEILLNHSINNISFFLIFQIKNVYMKK